MTDCAMLNLGRDKEPGSTRKIDYHTLVQLRECVPDRDTVLWLVEINEGDDNDEMALVRRVFKGWRLYGSTTHEPMLTSPDIPRCRSNVLWLPGTEVRKWSPRRSLLTLHRTDVNEAYLAGHAAAGSHGQGDRPDWAKPLLDRSWDLFRKAYVNKSNRLHTRGRNVTSMIDWNNYHLHEVGNEETVVHERTDYGRVRPAPGWEVHARALPPVAAHLDSHDILRMREHYERNAA